jgi:curved DNA-binding protein CbpA
MNLYERLGISRTASTAEIKRAYRKAISEVHPDTNSVDDSVAAEINVAYSVLKDPERRAHYDRTGSVSSAQPNDAKARDLIREIFLRAVEAAPDHEDLMAAVRRVLHLNMEKTAEQIAELEKKVALFERRRARLSFKGDGQNFLGEMLEDCARKAREGIASVREREDVLKRAFELAMDFAYRPEERPPPDAGPTGMFRWHSGTSTIS